MEGNTLRPQVIGIPIIKNKKKSSFRIPKFLVSIFQYILVTFIAIGAAYGTDVGQWFILAFALYALFIVKDIKFTFGVAFFLMLTVPFFQLTNQIGIAENAAIYVFELLVIGTLQAAWSKQSKG